MAGSHEGRRHEGCSRAVRAAMGLGITLVSFAQTTDKLVESESLFQEALLVNNSHSD